MQDEAKIEMKSSEIDSLKDLISCLKVRILEIKNDRNYGIGLSGMQSIETYMDKVLVDTKPFPIDVSTISKELLSSAEINNFRERFSRHSSVDSNANSSLTRQGDIILTLHIAKMGFKDASIFADPTLVSPQTQHNRRERDWATERAKNAI